MISRDLAFRWKRDVLGQVVSFFNKEKHTEGIGEVAVETVATILAFMAGLVPADKQEDQVTGFIDDCDRAWRDAKARVDREM